MNLRLILQEGKPRDLAGWPGQVVFVGAVALTFYVVISQLFVFPTMLVYRGTFISAMLALTFLVYSPTQKQSPTPLPADYLLAALSLTIGAYLQINADRILHRVAFMDDVVTADMIFAALAMLLALEAARRTVGWVLALIGILALVYMFSSGQITGLFRVAGGVSLSDATDSLFLTTGGLFGMPSGVLSTFIFPFCLFGAYLTVSGVGQTLFELAQLITGRYRGGIAKTACIGSTMFGMINGSAVANVATIGTITIPMMKKAGYPANFAGGVEATASTGGVILPPIMGAVAFVMAEVVGVPYREVMLAGFIPGFLYYFAVFLAIDAESLKLGLKGLAKEDLPKLIPALKRLVIFLLPISWLIYRLMMQITPTRAGFEAAGLIILAALLTPSRPSLLQILKGMEQGVRSLMSIGPAIVVAGLIQGVIQITGSGNKFTSLILSVGGESIVPVVLLTAVVAIILGMGMEITPTYILTVSLAGPALIMLGVPAFSASFFVMYCATMSVLTPPVALAAYTAAAIAGVKFWGVSFVAMRLAIVAYVLPFSIIFRPEILLNGTTGEVVITALEIFIAVFLLVAALNRRIFLPSNLLESGILVLAAGMLFFTDYYLYNLIGISAGAVVYLQQWVRRKRLDTSAVREAGRL